MLYGIGLMMILLTTAVESESLMVPLVMVVIGITLMAIGGGNNGKADAER